MSKDKKDYTVKKINIERDFADEVFKKYKYNRYGVGSCCTSNYTSKLNTKYICDYQDSEIFTYSKKVTTTTKYTVPSEGALNDADRPAWVDALCGMANEDVQIYCYYDASSLTASDVLKSYQAVKEWINTLGGENNSLSGCPNPKGLIQDFHTSVAGERWLDWAIQPITGIFNNSGSCGGVDSGCNTNTPPVDYGPCVQSTFSDAVLPSNANSKMWQTLKLFEDNGLTIYNSGGAGANIGGTYALTNPTIGLPPSATAKNVLVIVFADESAQGNTDGSVAQPYHNRSSIVPPTAMTWAAATIGTGTAADGSDASLTPCWKADYSEFKQQRALYLSQNPTHEYKCFLYPTKPTNINDTHRPFGLHALGAISSGNKPDVAATGSITFSFTIPTVGQQITLISTEGLSRTYTAGTFEDLATNTFNVFANGILNIVLSLKACIESPQGHGGQISVQDVVLNTGPQLLLTQATPGGFGNTTITSNLTNVTVANFTGGSPDGVFILNNALPNNGAPTCSLANLENITLGNPYYSQGFGGLDKFGWGIDVATLQFQPEQFANDINEFADVTTCQDTECLLFIISDQNGNRVEGYEIIWNGGVIGETDENGLFRYCVPNASVDTNHIFDLCTCITTTGNCNSQKISVTVTDDTCVEDCPDRPHEQCYIPPVISSGNENKGCTDPTACNYNPLAVNDDGSCTFCCTLFASLDSKTDATNDTTDDGAITVTVGGGIGPYTFQWFKDGVAYGTTQNLTGLPGGVYSLVVTDSSTNPPCITQLVVTIDAPDTIVYGCLDTLACNYGGPGNTLGPGGTELLPVVTIDDGSCLFKGCTDSTATNYDPAATADCNCNPPSSPLYQNDAGWDACCIPCIFGCTDINANNYNAAANCDDGTCTYNYSCVEVPGNGLVSTLLTSSLGEIPGVKGVQPCIIDANGEQAAYYDGTTDRCGSAVNVGVGPFDNSDEMLEYLTTISSWSSTLNNGADIRQYIFSYDLAAGYNVLCPVCSVPPAPPGILNTAPANPIRITFNFLYNWGTIIPNATQVSGGIYAYKYYTDLIELYSDIQLLFNAGVIILNDPQGNTITTAGAFTNTGPVAGTLSTEEINNAFAIAPYGWSTGGTEIKPNITMDFALCQCDVTQDTECECQEMLDGSGVYPTLADCSNDLTCCNTTPPPLLWECFTGAVSDSCNLKIGFSPMLLFLNDISAINTWCAIPPFNTDTGFNTYKYRVSGSAGSCIVPGTGVQGDSYWKYFISIELSVYDPSAGQSVTLGGLGISNWSWMDLLQYLNDAGIDGTTVDPVTGNTTPYLLNGATFSQVQSVIGQFNHPGGVVAGFELHYQVANCTCTYDDCTCIESVNGTYATEEECTAQCCGDSVNNEVAGCTQPSAANYNPGTTVDDGSCYACAPAPGDFLFVGSVGEISYTTDTNGTTDPSSYNVADGIIEINPTTLINGIPIAGSIQDYNATLYSATNGQSPLVANQLSQSPIIFNNLVADVYTVVFNHEDYPDCPESITITLADATPQVLYKCLPGVLTDSTSNLVFVNAFNPALQQIPLQAFANDAAFAEEITSTPVMFQMRLLWGFVAGSTDPSKCYSALWNGTKKIPSQLRVLDGAEVIYTDSTLTNTWLQAVKFDIIPAINNLSGVFINDSKIYHMNITELNTYLGSTKAGLRIQMDFSDASCSVTETQCIEDQEGIYTSEQSCLDNALCPTALTGTNSGCSLSGNAEPTNVVTGSNTVAGNSTPYVNNDNCLWCSNFISNPNGSPANQGGGNPGFSRLGQISAGLLSYFPIAADNTPNVGGANSVTYSSVATNNTTQMAGFLPVDKLYPGVYFHLSADDGNDLTNSSVGNCITIKKVLVGGDSNAFLDSGGNPQIIWGTDISDPYSYMPASAISVQFTNIIVNLNPGNGTYAIEIRDNTTGNLVESATGVTQFTSNNLPSGNYRVIVTIEAGNPFAGGKFEYGDFGEQIII